jgi:hypothetical protein
MASSTEDVGEYPFKVHVQTFTHAGVSENNYLLREFLQPDFKLQSSTESKFQWFHIPANNMAWVKVSLTNNKQQHSMGEFSLTNIVNLAMCCKTCPRALRHGREIMDSQVAPSPLSKPQAFAFNPYGTFMYCGRRWCLKHTGHGYQSRVR